MQCDNCRTKITDRNSQELRRSHHFWAWVLYSLWLLVVATTIYGVFADASAHMTQAGDVGAIVGAIVAAVAPVAMTKALIGTD